MAPKKIVLLACGSFNPPTNMHLRMFEIARDALTRQGHIVVGGVVSPVHNDYGKKELAPSLHRCNMVRLALSDSTWLNISEWESCQPTWVPTRQVLQYHQNLLNSLMQSNNESSTPQKRQRRDDILWLKDEAYYTHVENSDVPLQVKLLCGADLLESFGTPGVWKEEDVEAIMGQHGLVVITRDGCNPFKFIYESDLLTKYQNNIAIVTEWIANEVSSTKIRRALRRGESVKYLIPESVIKFVKEYNVYPDFSQNKYDNKSSSISLFPTPSPSDVIMSSTSPTLYLNDINNSRSNSGVGNHGDSYLTLPGSNRAQRPPSLLIEETATPDMGNLKKGLLGNVSFPGQAVQVLEVRPQAEGATDNPNATDHQHLPNPGASRNIDHAKITLQNPPCNDNGDKEDEEDDEEEEVDEETKVQIQITKDGIKVISDKETTV